MSRYVFKPYATNSKVDCPHCGGKKCFTLYIDTEKNNESLDTEFGRCDRENSCGYLKTPGQIGGGQYKSEDINIIPQQFVDKSIVEGCLTWYKKNPFTKCLVEKFGNNAEQVLLKYFVGTTKTLGTLFWTIDNNGVTHSGKVIHYIAIDSEEKLAPYRNKDKQPYYPFKTEDGYRPCFFGQHLVKKDSSLWIVESEKTAILCAILWPQYTWISGGGSNGVTSGKIETLKSSGFEGVVNIMPDADKAGREAMGRWTTNLDFYGYEVNVDDLGDQYQKGEDWADLILKDYKDKMDNNN